MEKCGSVTIRYMGYLTDLKGTREEEIRVCGERSVKDIVNIPGVNLEDLVILVDGRAAKPDSIVPLGSRITVMPHISGGSM